MYSMMERLWRQCCCCSFVLVLLLLSSRISLSGAQEQCAMEIWVYFSRTQCESNARNISAIGQLYADNTCRSTEVVNSTSSDAEALLPGIYSVRCLNASNVEFTQSGCASDTCSSSTSPSDPTAACDRDTSQVPAFYAMLDPPVYYVLDPTLSSRACLNLYSNNLGIGVTFGLYGDCAACLAATSTASPTSAGPNDTPVTLPTSSPSQAPPPPTTTPGSTGQPTQPSPGTEPPAQPTSPQTPNPSLRPTTKPPTVTPTKLPEGATANPTDSPTGQPLTPPTPKPQGSSTPAPNGSDPAPPTSDGGESSSSAASNLGIIIGSAVGGLAVLAICLVAGFLLGSRIQQDQMQKQAEMSKEATPSAENNGTTPAATTMVMPVASGANSPREIAVPLQQADEISMLEYPVTEGGMFDDQTTNTPIGTAFLEDDPTASISEGRSRLRSTDGLGTETGTTVTDTMSKGGPGAEMTPALLAMRDRSYVFDDDQSFEQQYTDAQQQHAYAQRFDVIVPRGPLGMVIDTPNGTPEVYAIKPDSILNGQVQVGDQLVAVNDIDVSDIADSLRVSAIIAKMANHKQRKLTFFRPG